MTKGLIIVDVQNDYFSGGAMELVGMEDAASQCRKLLDAFRTAQLPVFHIQHLSTHPGAGFFVPDTPGCEIHDSLQPFAGEAHITKHYPSAFRETDLQRLLQMSDIDELVICGAMSHMCIDTTVRAAFDLGYRCHLLADACATRDLEFNGRTVSAADVQGAFMAALSMPFAQVSSTQEYLASTST
ncbi:MAG: cysteine hydrolase [Gammaproteobacteria bacterium]|nr:cysteine hydrolase [Gammaproteobacteria bacterium]